MMDRPMTSSSAHLFQLDFFFHNLLRVHTLSEVVVKCSIHRRSASEGTTEKEN